MGLFAGNLDNGQRSLCFQVPRLPLLEMHLEWVYNIHSFIFLLMCANVWYFNSPQVNELVRAAGGSTFTPKKKSKSMGTIAVDEAKITGADTSTSTTAQTAPAAPSTPAPSAAADPSVVPVPVPVAQFGAMGLGAAAGGAAGAAAATQKPTFVDYVSGNCDLNMVRTMRHSGLPESAAMPILSTDALNNFTRSAWRSTLRGATAIPAGPGRCTTSAPPGR